MHFPKALKKFLRLRLGLKPLFDYVEIRSRLAGVRDLPIGTVFDVGANVGKMARTYRKIFPAAQVYSFEPVPATYEKPPQAPSSFDAKDLLSWDGNHH